MINTVFSFLDQLDDLLWECLGFPALIFLGIYFTYISGFVQLRKFPQVISHFWHFLMKGSKHQEGVSPIRAFFACLGGCVGIGNIVAVCTAVQIGGPGALFWVWVTALLGMLIKYAEVYLGCHFRIQQSDGTFRGGPMYFLKHTFSATWISSLVAILLCIYGVEIFQFNVITYSLSDSLSLHPMIIGIALLILVLITVQGGVERVGAISSVILPLFMIFYIGMGLWIIGSNLPLIPSILKEVFISAFTGHAAIGGFAGSSLLLTISQGIRRACYSSDIGVGYASVIHSETSSHNPKKQASLTIFDVFLDSFCICTISILLILITGVWKEPIHASKLVETVLSEYFPLISLFMPLFLFLLGYSTIIAYFCVGLKCANYLHPRFGSSLFYIYGIPMLLFFSVQETHHAIMIMSMTQVSLLLINVCGIYRLRHQVSFSFSEEG